MTMNNGTMNMNADMVSQPTNMNYTSVSGDGSMGMNDMVSQQTTLNYSTNSGDGTMNMNGMVTSVNMGGMVSSQPASMNYPMQMGQPATQTSNVYSTVPSYMEMPAQQMVYDNSQQNMMTPVQNGMMNNNFGVMQQNGLMAPTQQNMGQNMGMMNNSMFNQVGQVQNGLMMGQSQMQQPQQQMMHNGYMPQMMAPQQDAHMTQLGDHMTQPHDNQMMQFTQESLPTTEVNPIPPTQISTAQTEESNFTNTTTTVIVHEEDMDTDITPLSEESRRHVGIQCEVGPETIRALKEEEAAFEQEEHQQDQQMGDGSESYGQPGSVEGNLAADGENTTERLVQKYPCESEDCSKAYIHRKDLIRHMKNRHGISPKKLETIVMEMREKPFICPVLSCRRSYFHLKDLRRHQRLCHNVNPESVMQSSGDGVSNTEEKTQLRYPCDFPGCLRSYVHKKDLIRHKRLYHKDPSTKPSIPLPVRYTELELKRIRQEVKQEIDKTVQKIRLDSTGSTVPSSGEEPPNSASSLEPEIDLSAAGVLASLNPNSIIDQPPTSLSLNIVDSMQLALLIGSSGVTTTTASSNPVQLSDILEAAGASSTANTKPLPADASLAQIINNAVQSGVVLTSVPSPPPLQSEADKEESSETKEADEVVAAISSEAAAIIRSLDQSQQLTVQVKQDNDDDEKEKQQPDNQLITNLSTVVFPASGSDTLFNVGSLLNGSSTPATSTSVSTPSVTTSPPPPSTVAGPLDLTKVEEMETKPEVTDKSDDSDDTQCVTSGVVVTKGNEDESLQGGSNSLQKMYIVANQTQEMSEVS